MESSTDIVTLEGENIVKYSNDERSIVGRVFYEKRVEDNEDSSTYQIFTCVEYENEKKYFPGFVSRSSEDYNQYIDSILRGKISSKEGTINRFCFDMTGIEMIGNYFDKWRCPQRLTNMQISFNICKYIQINYDNDSIFKVVVNTENVQNDYHLFIILQFFNILSKYDQYLKIPDEVALQVRSDIYRDEDISIFEFPFMCRQQVNTGRIVLPLIGNEYIETNYKSELFDELMSIEIINKYIYSPIISCIHRNKWK